MVKRVRVRGKRFSNRLRYNLGGNYNSFSEKNSDYATFRHSAEVCEENADGAPLGLKGTWYEKAAKSWLAAEEVGRAAESYKLAAHQWDRLAEAHLGESEEKLYRQRFDKARKNMWRLQKVSSGKWRGLEGVTTLIGLIGGLFFLSNNLTGNVIGNLTNSTSNILGASFLIVGLVGGFYWVKNRKTK